MSVTFATRPLWMLPYPVADYTPLPAVGRRCPCLSCSRRRRLGAKVALYASMAGASASARFSAVVTDAACSWVKAPAAEKALRVMEACIDVPVSVSKAIAQAESEERLARDVWVKHGREYWRHDG